MQEYKETRNRWISRGILIISVALCFTALILLVVGIGGFSSNSYRGNQYCPSNTPGVHNVGGGGNCLFRAFSMAKYGTENQHLQLRREIADYELIFLPQVMGDFISDNEIIQGAGAMRNSGTLGGENEMLTASRLYNWNVSVLDCASGVHHTYSPFDVMPGELLRPQLADRHNVTSVRLWRLREHFLIVLNDTHH